MGTGGIGWPGAHRSGEAWWRGDASRRRRCRRCGPFAAAAVDGAGGKTRSGRVSVPRPLVPLISILGACGICRRCAHLEGAQPLLQVAPDAGLADIRRVSTRIASGQSPVVVTVAARGWSGQTSPHALVITSRRRVCPALARVGAHCPGTRAAKDIDGGGRRGRTGGVGAAAAAAGGGARVEAAQHGLGRRARPSCSRLVCCGCARDYAAAEGIKNAGRAARVAGTSRPLGAGACRCLGVDVAHSGLQQAAKGLVARRTCWRGSCLARRPVSLPTAAAGMATPAERQGRCSRARARDWV